MCTGTISYKHDDNYRHKLSSCLPPYVNAGGSVAVFEFQRAASTDRDKWRPGRVRAPGGTDGAKSPAVSQPGATPPMSQIGFFCRSGRAN